VRLGDTVDALAYKVSAPRRLTRRAAGIVRGRPQAVAVAGVCGVALTLAALSRRRRR
jgi:hypothetical protein